MAACGREVGGEDKREDVKCISGTKVSIYTVYMKTFRVYLKRVFLVVLQYIAVSGLDLERFWKT